MPDEKDQTQADPEKLPDTPLHGQNEGRALDQPEEAEGGPPEDRDEGDEPQGDSGTPPADGGDQGLGGSNDDTPVEAEGDEGLGTAQGATAGEPSQPKEDDTLDRPR
jgi:hypothetical protein